MRLFPSSVAAALALAAGPALAADLPAYQPAVTAPASAFTWTGFYAGVQGGYAWGDAGLGGGFGLSGGGDFTTDGFVETGEPLLPFLDPCLSDCAVSIDQDVFYQDSQPGLEGWAGGITLGYNHQFGRFVLGVEADASFADIDLSGQAVETWERFLAYDYTDDDIADQEIYEEFTLETRYEAEIDAFGTLRARAGFAAGRIVPFVTGGLAWGRVSVSGEASVTSDGFWDNSPPATPPYDGTWTDEVYGTAEGSGEEWLFGYALGAGVEVALTDRWSVKGEYLYTDLGEAELEVSGENGTGSEDVEIDFHQLKAGVNFRF